MRSHSPDADSGESPATYSRRRLLTLGLALATPAAVIAALAGQDRQRAATTPPPVPTPPASNVATTLSSSTVPPSTATSVQALDHPLTLGMSGDEKILLLQDRLRAVGFDPGPTDGYFGEATRAAVWAFEKLLLGVASGDVTGIVSPSMWTALHAAVMVTPRRPGIPGRHVEVYLPEQVAVVFTDGAATLISHVSSGEGTEWCDVVTVDNDDGTETTKGICGVSITPGGVYHFERKVDGWRQAALGRLYNPVYFNYGIAIHGASSVPSRPASRGCVRIPMHIAEYFPDLVTIGELVFVFDGIEEPEHYGAQLPVFDRLDPTYTTTTSTSTTSSTTTSTTAPATSTTTAAPTTTPSSDDHRHPATTATTTSPTTAPTTAPSTTSTTTTTTIGEAVAPTAAPTAG